MTISMSGLNLSFLRKNNLDTARPGRYRYDAEEGVIPAHVHAHKHRRPDRRSTEVALPFFMPDVDAAYGGAWKSIVDGSEISSRSNWREHNKRNCVLQIDGDHWGKTEDDYVTQIEKRMGYDPSLIGNSDTFSWKEPE